MALSALFAVHRTSLHLGLVDSKQRALNRRVFTAQRSIAVQIAVTKAETRSHRPLRTMCYYKLSIFMHCGHSTFSDMPVGFCKAAMDYTVRLSGSPSRQQRESTISTTSTVVSRADSMNPEGQRKSRSVEATRAIRPCAQGQIHPLQTRRLERLCAVCQQGRDERIEALESLSNAIQFEPWKWQFKYQGGSTSMQPTKAEEAAPRMEESASVWRVSTTLNNLVTGSPGWMKDWKRQESDVAD